MKKIFLILIFFLLPHISFAAIAFGNAKNDLSCNAAGGTSCTFSYTTSGSNIALICNMVSYGSNPGASTMTYAGASMTQIGSNQNFGGTVYEFAFYIINAASGVNNVVTNTTNNISNGFAFHCASYTGVGGTDGTTQHTSSTVTTDSVTLTSTIINDWLIGTLSSGSGRTWNAGANTTNRTFDSQGGIYDSNSDLSIGSHTINMIIAAGSDNTGIDGIYFTPSIPADTTKRGINGATLVGATIYSSN